VIGRRAPMTTRPSDAPHDACGAKTRAGTPCKARRGWGTDHAGYGRCRLHGGSSPSGRKSAGVEQARAAVASYGLSREVDPHSALLEELHRTAGHVAWLGSRVAELQESDMAHPVGGGQGGWPSIEPHIWIKLYQEERRHLASVAKDCVKVGIEERRVHLAERQGEMIAQVLRGVLADLGVADDPNVPAIVRRHLTLVGDGA